MWPIKRRDITDPEGDVYLTKLTLPFLKQYEFHIFHRGDHDPDPHDHPWAFDTFPLVAYVEEVWKAGTTVTRIVSAGEWQHREAEHCHRVLEPHWHPFMTPDGTHMVINRWNAAMPRSYVPWYTRLCWAIFGPEKIITVIKKGEDVRNWGFRRSDGVWVPWREYIARSKTWMGN